MLHKVSRNREGKRGQVFILDRFRPSLKNEDLTQRFFSGNQSGRDIMFIVMLIPMVVFGYFIMKKMVFDLIDEVYDEGSTLLFKNEERQARINLRDIKNVRYKAFSRPPRVTISLRYETELGTELSFSPQVSLIFFKKNKDVVNLIDRINRARG